jgi:dihydrofolate reductase
MWKLIAIAHVTLDGVMQSRGGPEEDPRGGFTHGGWIWPSGATPWTRRWSRSSGDFDLLLGRRTYEIFAAS